MTEPGTSVTNDDELKTKLTNMMLVKLKQELRKRKRKTAGLKNELILRLLPFMQLEREHGEADQGDDAKSEDDTKDARRKKKDDSESDSSSDECETRRGVRRRSQRRGRILGDIQWR